MEVINAILLGSALLYIIILLAEIRDELKRQNKNGMNKSNE